MAVRAAGRAGGFILIVLVCGAHRGARTTITGRGASSDSAATMPPRALVVGTPAHIDVRRGGSFFAGLRGPIVRYTVRFWPDADGLTAVGGRIGGAPVRPGVVQVTMIARDARGDSAIAHLPLVVFAAGLQVPLLPDSGFPYSNLRLTIPRHFVFDVTGSAIAEDNTPPTNHTTDAGATLGRVLFYDTRLSADDRVACASCHQQQFGFADTARFSRGEGGALTLRHTMALANARFYRSGRFFRDERAATLEDQVLEPIRNPIEMGETLDAVTLKLQLTPYYPPLFRAAFGTPEITADRVARALAQFVRSLVSSRAPVDSIFRGGGPPDSTWVSPQAWEGRRLFIGQAGCSRCHRTNALELDLPDNIGLDSVPADSGAGGGRFKAPALRNIAIRPPYMHDGRFGTLEDVIEFYDSGVRANSSLDPRLRAPDGAPSHLNLTPAQRGALVAYLTTFTDQAFIHDVRFSNPFVLR
jgi:cytochrome c peroxidase